MPVQYLTLRSFSFQFLKSCHHWNATATSNIHNWKIYERHRRKWMVLVLNAGWHAQCCNSHNKIILIVVTSQQLPNLLKFDTLIMTVNVMLCSSVHDYCLFLYKLANLKTEAGNFFETLLNIYQTSQYLIPEDHKFKTHCLVLITA